MKKTNMTLETRNAIQNWAKAQKIKIRIFTDDVVIKIQHHLPSDMLGGMTRIIEIHDGLAAVDDGSDVNEFVDWFCKPFGFADIFTIDVKVETYEVVELLCTLGGFPLEEYTVFTGTRSQCEQMREKYPNHMGAISNFRYEIWKRS